MIRAIVAMDERRGIAARGNPPWNIPWHIPTDLQHFRSLTEGGTVLMGRNTYELFDQPLPNRTNFVASRSLLELREGFELVSDVDAFLRSTRTDIWVIGGASLYAATLALCDELHITHIVGDYNCDTFFPNYKSSFELVERGDRQIDNGYAFHFATYKKTGKS